MKIGNYEIDDALFTRYLRVVIASNDYPRERTYDNKRWELHREILASIELHQTRQSYNSNIPGQLQTPTRGSRTLEDNDIQKTNQETRDFNLALEQEVELFIKKMW